MSTKMNTIVKYESIQEIVKDLNKVYSLVNVSSGNITAYANFLLTDIYTNFQFNFPMFCDPLSDPNAKATGLLLPTDKPFIYMSPLLFRSIVINFFIYLYLQFIKPQDSFKYYEAYKLGMNNFCLSDEGRKSPFLVTAKQIIIKKNRGSFGDM